MSYLPDIWRQPTAGVQQSYYNAAGRANVGQFSRGSSFMGMQLSYPTWTPFITSYSNIFSTLFYASLVTFAIFLILVFIHATTYPIFSFSNDTALVSVPTVSDYQISFTKSPAASDLSGNFFDVPVCTYTIGMDVFLSGNFQASTLPRVLLYRALTNSVSPPQTDTKANLVTRFPDSNIIVWLDPIKNDLFVSIVTSSDGTAATRKLETISAIENVPVKKVFRVTIVFTQQILEVYINSNLEQSMALKHPPSTVSNKSVFFPVISSIGPNVLISHLVFWPRALSVREVRAAGDPITNDTFYSKSAF